MFIPKILRNYLLMIIIGTTLPVCGSDFLCGRDVFLEFRGAYFHPTGSRFKKIYGGGGALYGPELTVQLFEDCCNWYGFISVDWFQKKGHSIGLHTPTKIHLLPLAFGIKYFLPPCYECVDFYVGLGFQPVRVHISNCSSFVTREENKWVCGGIAKVGSYVYLPDNFFLDFFIAYSFARASSHIGQVAAGPVVPLSSSISGAIFGGGIGYRF
jgi:hypothetical protein